MHKRPSPPSTPARPPTRTHTHTRRAQVRPPALEEVALLKEHARLVSYIYPSRNKELLAALAGRKARPACGSLALGLGPARFAQTSIHAPLITTHLL